MSDTEDDVMIYHTVDSMNSLISNNPAEFDDNTIVSMESSDIADHLTEDLIMEEMETVNDSRHATYLSSALEVLPTSTARISNKMSIETYLLKTIHEESLDSAFCVIDLAEIVHSVQSWRINAPRVEPVFPVAVNPNATVLSMLQSQDVSFTVASTKEVASEVTAKDVVSPVHIMDSSHVRGDKYVKSVVAAGINNFLVDSVEDILRISKFTKSPSIMVNLGNLLSDKLLTDILQAAAVLHFEVTGVAIGITRELKSDHADYYSSLKSIVDALFSAKRAIAIGADYGFTLKKLHFAGRIVDDLVLNHCDYSEALFGFNSSINHVFPLEEFPNLCISADAMDSLVGKSHTIAAIISGVKHGSEESMYYIDDGIYGSFHCNMIGPNMTAKLSPKSLQVSNGEGSSRSELTRSTVWGPTCDSLDVVGKDIPLCKMSVGDWLYFKNCGSFSISNGTEFNGVLAPRVRFVYSTIQGAVSCPFAQS
jgi:ornithine decarboxylase